MLYDKNYWYNELALSADSLKKFHETGRTIVKRYLDEEQSSKFAAGSDPKRYNMFWANVGILKSALYGNAPKPTARREFADPDDDVGRVAAAIMERLLAVGPGGDGADMHAALTYSVEDRLIPGMGQIWLRYESKVEEVGVEGAQVATITDESVCTDYLHWQDFFYSPARVWEEVVWVARRVWMTKEQIKVRFPGFEDKIAYKIPKDGVAYTDSNSANVSLQRGEVFEIWCKTSGKVYWVSKGCEEILDTKDDPLKIPGFFPCPRPLMATTTTTKFIARADYTLMQDQYSQLDDLNIRIATLTQACKAVGVYDKTAEGVQRMLNQGVENQLIPVDNWAMFAEKGGIKGVVDWVPVEAIVNVLDKLRELRTDTVQQIYELSGISDIMRGVTNARETAKAQTLKSQYSSSRLQLYQMQVGFFVASAMQIKALIISKHWQRETIIRKSLVMMTPDAMYAEQAVDLIKNTFDMMYRIDVSSTQMSIPDYNAEKEARMAYVELMGEFIAKTTPLMEKAPGVAPFLLKLMQWASASFQTSGGVETLFDNYVRALEMKLKQAEANPPQPSPMEQAELAKTQSEAAENQAQAAKLAAETQALQGGGQAKVMEMQAKIQADIEGQVAKTQADIMAKAAKTQADIALAKAKADAKPTIQ
jgi:hypothetical protein